MCLLHLLWQQSQALGFSLCAATFDHKLRPDSAQDVQFVRDWCQAHGIACRAGGGAVAVLARAQGLTLEESGRLLRYRFLEQCRCQLGADYIATAHNADDNAETLLLHLLRGSGLKGLGGIPPRRGAVIRPLLSCSRAEIADYCARHGVPHREDTTNRDTTYTRNYLRHEIMPLLRAKNPALTQTLARTAQVLRADESYLDRQAKQAAAQLLQVGRGQVSLSAAALRSLDPALALRLVQEMADRAAPGTVLPQNQREALLELAGEKRAGKISLTNRLRARRVYDMLILSLPSQEQTSFAPFSLLPGESRTLFELGYTVSCATVDAPEAQRGDGTLYLLRPPVDGPLSIRPREIGDRIRLPGRPEKTLKKLFQEAKIPPEERGRVPVLLLDGSVAAVYGFGVDTRWTPSPGSLAWQVQFIKTDEKEKGSV